MKLNTGGFALLAVAILAGCGGGGTSGPIPAPPIPKPPVTSGFPQASGKPMAFANGSAIKVASAMRSHEGALRHPFSGSPTPTPSPNGSPTPVPTPTPTPTPVPIPSPTGLPQVPTTLAIYSGFNLAGGTSAFLEVLDATTRQPVAESNAPTWISSKSWLINPTGVTPYPSGTILNLKDAWSVAFQQTVAAPYHAQVAFTFPDSTGVVDMYSYDGFALTPSDPGVNFDPATGVAKAATSTTTADFYIDSQGVEAPGGIQRVADQNPNVFGDPTPAFHNLMSLPTFASDGPTLSYGHVCVGCIYATKDSHGLLHKFMITLSDTNRMFFMQLGADVTGAFAF